VSAAASRHAQSADRHLRPLLMFLPFISIISIIRSS
jgi:hypothetical protein